jgi:hypothetical protein
MPDFKEPMFFAYQGQSRPWAIDTWSDYQELFRDAHHFIACGEASTLYLWHPNAALNIHRQIPDVRLIAVLRNPMERAFSQYTFQRLLNVEPYDTFAKALAAEAERQRSSSSAFLLYTEVGRYGEQIARYQALFPSEQIQIVLNEDLQDHPNRVFSEIFQHIGVDPLFQPKLEHRTNPSGIPKKKALYERLKAGGRKVKGLIPSRLAMQLSGALDQRYLTHPYLERETYNALLAQFRDDILYTQELIGRDLSHWLEPMEPNP